MGKLLGIRIQRFKALEDLTIGKYEYDKEAEELPPFTCLIGPNGSGKSTLLDAFGFLSDCLLENVEIACDKSHRGGFESLRTQGTNGPIEFTLYYREDSKARPISYSLAIDLKGGHPVVAKEELRQRRDEAGIYGRPYKFLDLEYGRGRVWKGETTDQDKSAISVPVALDDIRRLGITTLGQLKEHPRIRKLRAFMEGWYLSYFIPGNARALPMAGAQEHLNRTGDNLANVVQHMEREHRSEFKSILDKIAKRIPGITKIAHDRSKDRRLLLAFSERGFGDPFYAANMSDGTLKLFAYLLLTHDPQPRPFIGIEEPENGLYHKLLGQLASEFNAHAQVRETNVLVTTHSPYFVDSLQPEQVWLISRNEKGRSVATRAADMLGVREMAAEGVPLGSLWYSNHLNDRLPL